MSEKILPGMSAPNFVVTDVFDKTISLEAMNKKYTLIVFLRYAGCPWCNLAVHRLAFEQELLRKHDCEVVAFIQSDKENIFKNIYERHERKPKFSIIPDQKMVIYEKYGVRPSISKTAKMLKQIPHWIHAVRKGGFPQANVDGSLLLAPAAFLISPYTQNIIHVEHSADLYDNNTFTRLYEAIARHDLQAVTLNESIA